MSIPPGSPEQNMKALAITLVLALALPLAACGQRDTPPAADAGAGAQPTTALGRTVAKAMDKARAELATGNIQLNGFNVTGKNRSVVIGNGNEANDTRPKAEITPQGELLIDGRKVAATPQQQALLKEYRGNIEQIALAGMDVGVAGADLGMKAATEAIGAVFSGNSDQVEQRMEAEAQQIEAAAMKLCGYLPAMLDTQTRLAAAMPEFRPYATMDQSDVDDCHRDGSTTAEQVRTQMREDIRREVRTGVRDAVRGAAQATGVAQSDAAGQDAAAEAEAASETEAATR
jgi:hypothetical protein